MQTKNCDICHLLQAVGYTEQIVYQRKISRQFQSSRFFSFGCFLLPLNENNEKYRYLLLHGNMCNVSVVCACVLVCVCVCVYLLLLFFLFVFFWPFCLSNNIGPGVWISLLCLVYSITFSTVIVCVSMYASMCTYAYVCMPEGVLFFIFLHPGTPV